MLRGGRLGEIRHTCELGGRLGPTGCLAVLKDILERHRGYSDKEHDGGGKEETLDVLRVHNV